MELLILIVLLIVLALASLRWGVDSRPAPYAKEHELAVLGLRWPEPERAAAPAAPAPERNGTATSLACPRPELPPAWRR